MGQEVAGAQHLAADRLYSIARRFIPGQCLPGRGAGRPWRQGAEQGGFRSTMKRAAAGLFSLLMLSDCARAPLGYLDGEGPAARSIASLGWGLLGFSVAVCLITGALLVVSIFRRRSPPDGLGG